VRHAPALEATTVSILITPLGVTVECATAQDVMALTNQKWTNLTDLKTTCVNQVDVVGRNKRNGASPSD
jgi:hypothetical protein